MSKTSKVKKSKKPKRRSPGTYAAYAVLTFDPSWYPSSSPKPDQRTPAEALASFGLPSSKLAAANAAFDAAILGAVKACLGCCATPRIRAGSRSKETLATVKSYEAAQDAGHALQETAAAIFRARAEEQPIPVKLTAKGKTAKLKPFHAVPSRRRSK